MQGEKQWPASSLTTQNLRADRFVFQCVARRHEGEKPLLPQQTDGHGTPYT